MENVKINLTKKEGKTKAFVKVTEGRLTANFQAVEVDGVLYLNNPSQFVKSLKGTTNGNGKTHTGFVDQAYLTDKEFKNEILDEIRAMLDMEKEA
jgi:hypothetical protein